MRLRRRRRRRRRAFSYGLAPLGRDARAAYLRSSTTKS
ncbi:hypothetical protein BUH_0859 [Burkholderia pseudomallei Pakistan 9]|nr:hypothetical protein BURPSPAST_Z0010 [Burkholderia pseudomallei Pasteur 52237]EDU09099.1 hypothetical protein BURPS1655_K0411 [Burkholderia pseudomallei 1655]EEH30319.1 hypothetical protein BUH_0859 [Burkholderia pseudomallei Pakistan 9]